MVFEVVNGILCAPLPPMGIQFLNTPTESCKSFSICVYSFENLINWTLLIVFNGKNVCFITCTWNNNWYHSSRPPFHPSDVYGPRSNYIIERHSSVVNPQYFFVTNKIPKCSTTSEENINRSMNNNTDHWFSYYRLLCESNPNATTK